MLRNIKYELYKVQREIKMHGERYTFERVKQDDFNESTEEKEIISAIRGLFHISKGYVTEQTSDGTRTHTKGQPMLLVAWEDAQTIENGDYVTVNQNQYKVIEKNNIEEQNIVCDVSLEMVLNGFN